MEAILFRYLGIYLYPWMYKSNSSQGLPNLVYEDTYIPSFFPDSFYINYCCGEKFMIILNKKFA